MRKLFTLFAAVLLTATLWAQSPEKMSYQSVIRDDGGNLVTEQEIGMQISILQGSASGAPVYVETQTPKTNANGLVSIEIGTGNTSDDFSAIDWANGPYFIKTETDPAGGTSYSITGTSQLLSVPYALHAKTAETVTGGITETDPVFGAWDKSTGISITESQITDLTHFTTADETDPVFGSSVASGITGTDTTSWNNKLDSYTETDPVFSSWDKSTGISITESQITDLNHFTNADETDPVYGSSVASGITGTDTTNWNNKLDSETDPAFTSSQAANIDATDITNLDNLSGVNTGDQDLSTLATKTALGDSTAQVRSEIPDVSGIAINEQAIQDTASQIRGDMPEVPTGTQTGDMQYWDGSAWVTIEATENDSATLQMIDGVPTWVGGTPSTSTVTTVTNPATGKTWMDRNLGASQVATSSTDADAYGDLYQWGRAADGHEKRNSGTTSTLSNSDTPGHGDFITNSSDPYDWRSPQNDNLWQGVNGTNNPCPSGYRLPTQAEWEAERQSWNSNDAAGAFASPLKLPVAGFRNDSDGSLGDVGSFGYCWSSTVSGTRARTLYFDSGIAGMSSYFRARGSSVRCLKDDGSQSPNQPPSAPNTPQPTDGATAVGIDISLQWSCSDPDGDALTYDVYFDGTGATTLVSEGQTDSAYATATLEYSATYHWKIIAKDGNGNQTTSATWSFTTMADTGSTSSGHKDTTTAVVDVTNPATGKTWMDRNLGASQVATSSTDADAYGDLYQWGRAADGHEKRNSGTTSTLSNSDTPGHGDFITNSSDPYDWRSPQNDNLWQGVNGTNNPCPSGYRLPTQAEWEAERQSWSSNDAAGAFASPLKLPVAGYRHLSTGSLYHVGSFGYCWSSTVSGAFARRLVFYSSNADLDDSRRARGYSVRCLKD